MLRRLKKKYPLVALILVICLTSNAVIGQSDQDNLQKLIQETNEVFLYPFAQGIYLSPYELVEFNRSRILKNIEMVASMDVIIKQDTTPILIKDNRTIIHKPTDQYNSRTYFYHKDGRINKILRGMHLDDLYRYDKGGFLIQHGHGGELKKAKRRGKEFEWFNVKRNRLEYITTYNEQDKLRSIKSSGHYFGPFVDYELEEYTWKENQLLTQNTILQYKDGGTDTTFMEVVYDSLGAIQTIRSRKDDETRWSESEYLTKVYHPTDNTTKITLLHKEYEAISITFDQYNNWIELARPNRTIRRDIRYRKNKRKK